MKKILALLLLGLFLSGCTTLNHWQKQWNATRDAIIYRQDLVGMSREQMLEKFGKPDSSSVSYSQNLTIESWGYELSAFGSMNVVVTNGVVTNINYY